jgi:hypothetical protein
MHFKLALQLTMQWEGQEWFCKTNTILGHLAGFGEPVAKEEGQWWLCRTSCKRGGQWWFCRTNSKRGRAMVVL